MTRTAVVSLLLLCGSLFLPAVARPLTSSEKASFRRDFSSTCIAGPHVQAMVRSHGGSARQLKQYCDCAGNYFAAHLSYEQARDPTGNFAAMHEAAYRTCVAKVFKK